MTAIRSDMVANVWKVMVAVGEAVDGGDELVILESMKMEIPVEAPHAGTVTALHVYADQVVNEGDLIAEVERPRDMPPPPPAAGRL